MTILKSISVSMFLAACLALYIAILVLFNPTLPGAASLADTRMAYSCAILLLAIVCCVIAGLTWGYSSSRIRPGTAVMTALSLWFVLLVVVCVRFAVTDRLPL